jgi:glycosyltransferase involved in cell wall biosynthesis
MISYIVLFVLFALFGSLIIYFLFFRTEKNYISELNQNHTLLNTTIMINETIEKTEEIIDLNKEITKYEKTLRKIGIEEIREFRKLNNEGILYDRDKYKRSEHPDISVVMTTHNQAHCVHKAIRSIQNQSLKNLEIIIVDDFSLDNSTETIKKYMNEDNRITLIINNYNKGVMVARNQGIRKAKGKYITVLDADDTFIHKDILNYSLNIANLADLDIIEFHGYYFKNGTFKTFVHKHNSSGIIYQPELRNKFIIFSDDDRIRPFRCRTVWGKLIRNELYQKALDNIPKKYLDDYILIYEDAMVTLSLYKIAKNYYNFKHPGYYYTSDEKYKSFPFLPNKTSLIKKGVVRGIDHVKFLDYLLETLEDNEFNKLFIYHELKAMDPYSFSNLKRTVTHHFEMLYVVLDDLIKSKYLTDKQKEKVMNMKKTVQENEIGIKSGQINKQ